jgi:hypothetical protein
MHQHAVWTAATLYAKGTWTRDEAATYAGIRPNRLETAVERLGSRVRADPPRVRVAAD